MPLIICPTRSSQNGRVTIQEQGNSFISYTFCVKDLFYSFLLCFLKCLPEERENTGVGKLETVSAQFQTLKPLEGPALAYAAGYILKIKTKLTNCIACKYNVLKRANGTDDFNYLIKYEECCGKTLQR